MSQSVKIFWAQWEQYKKDQDQIKQHQADIGELIAALEEIASGENDFSGCAYIAQKALDSVVLKNPKDIESDE